MSDVNRHTTHQTSLSEADWHAIEIARRRRRLMTQVLIGVAVCCGVVLLIAQI